MANKRLVNTKGTAATDLTAQREETKKEKLSNNLRIAAIICSQYLTTQAIHQHATVTSLHPREGPGVGVAYLRSNNIHFLGVEEDACRIKDSFPGQR